ncbi:MAG: 2Fe-2S iron-sulfur cluster binding domain-containing protein [Ignavibacteria bacterium]|nr:2Fe-2S iron-sulfur cluster binding domain-containing protein [Ignavibacteria bacterium]
MSLKLYPIKVSKKSFLTPDSVKISLDIPDELKTIFAYHQGQYLSIKISINGAEYSREYSLCSSPYTDTDYSFASKIVKDGIVSSYLFHSVNAGDTIFSYPPQGNFFTELHPMNKKLYFLIAGGSGITPVYSILKSVLIKEPESRIVLYYGNNTMQSIMFKDELDELHVKYNNRFSLHYSLTEYESGWNGFKGLMNIIDIESLFSKPENINFNSKEFFICGPVDMMTLVKTFLEMKNIPDENVHIEYFKAPAAAESDDESDLKNYQDKRIRIILDGNEHEVVVPSGKVILDAALDSDLNPPFSCRSGICSTCRAKLYSGKVKMDEREGLSDSEIEDGYILTCQSHPLTDDVKLEYK